MKMKSSKQETDGASNRGEHVQNKTVTHGGANSSTGDACISRDQL